MPIDVQEDRTVGLRAYDVGVEELVVEREAGHAWCA
jgi:hypothetical protein